MILLSSLPPSPLGSAIDDARSMTSRGCRARGRRIGRGNMKSEQGPWLGHEWSRMVERHGAGGQRTRIANSCDRRVARGLSRAAGPSVGWKLGQRKGAGGEGGRVGRREREIGGIRQLPLNVFNAAVEARKRSVEKRSVGRSVARSLSRFSLSPWWGWSRVGRLWCCYSCFVFLFRLQFSLYIRSGRYCHCWAG